MLSFWFIVSICGIGGQFLIDYLIKKKRQKFIAGIIVMAFTILALALNTMDQSKETGKTSVQLSEIKLQNQELQKKLIGRDSAIAAIRSQYDSIRFQNGALQTSLANISKQQAEAKSLGQKTVEEVDRSRAAIESIRQKTGIRSISSEARARMIQILAPGRGKVSVSSVANNPEAYSLKVALIDILKTAGWNVREGSAYFTMPPRIGITIIVKNASYPKRAELITECLNLCNLKWSSQFDDKLLDDDISVMVDH